ncbi:unnamed protein product [Rotaria sordida]|uniref:Uncharacterized protein n=1 Tax=Rotaria sordida TaxID=392033 RepID=A0A814C1L3_9BILA|nr:unnamed protein product [Rotaria sordida]CAF0937883.1 unnamed protein product [Rotaria sordida]CAF0945536.1 unnamed protein product [Rotaria sordida]
MQDSDDRVMLCPFIDYAQEPILPLADACIPLIFIIPDILMYVSMALERTPDNPPDELTRDESASIHLYTMEESNTGRSLYSHLNHTLKRGGPEELQPWFKYLKLFLTALVEIPCSTAQVVWGGVRKNATNEFPKGAQIT